MTHMVIIGGSDAGISAALRAKEVDSTASVTVLIADSFPNYSICGLPFYLSGEVPDWHALAHPCIAGCVMPTNAKQATRQSESYQKRRNHEQHRSEISHDRGTFCGKADATGIYPFPVYAQFITFPDG